MKQSHLLITVLLVLLIVIGWGSAVVDVVAGDNSEYRAYCELAEDYFARGLYQKAAQEYENAVVAKSDEEGWSNLLKAYAARYEEDDEIYDSYLDAALRAIQAFPENADFILTAVSLYIDDDFYKAAYTCIEDALNAGVDDPQVLQRAIEVKYAYEVQMNTYTDYSTFVNGYYAVEEYDAWVYIANDGSGEDLGRFVIAGPVGEEGVRVYSDGSRSILIDAEGVVQGILSEVPEAAGVYSEGLVPIRYNGQYAYHDILGDKKFGAFEEAGSFYNGYAAVNSGGNWYVIDTAGEKTADTTYDEIVLNPDGSYLKNDIMLAKKDGAYRIYDSKGKTVGDFSCEDVDIVTDDGLIAFCEGGKWGFVDCEGKTVIEPSYAGAKSFSNGLAAVSDGKLWGFINTDGTLVVEYQFLEADYFNDESCCMVLTAVIEVEVLPESTEEKDEETTDTTEATEPTETAQVQPEDQTETTTPVQTELQDSWQLLSLYIPLS